MPVLDQSYLRSILVAVFDHASPVLDQSKCRLVGTGAALLQGVQLPTRDVDLLMKEREDVDTLGSALSSFECLTPPTYLSEAKQYYANYEINGVEVGISTVEWETDSDGIECFGRGPWEHYILIPCGPYTVPTVTLELRLVSELLRDRPDRYTPLIEHMRVRGCDIELVRRGMAARGFSQDIQKEFLDRLKETCTSAR
jgi:hypothetical protein